MNWYYESRGQQQGPLPDSEFDRLIATGVVTPDTLVWTEGQATWRPLKEVRPVAPPVPSAPGAEPPPGPAHGELAICDQCGRTVLRSDTILIGSRTICSTCKPQVVELLQSGGEIGDHSVVRTGPPWEQRDQLGWLKAGWETIRLVLLEPSKAFSEMRRDGIVSAMIFYGILNSVGTLLTLAYQAGLLAVTGTLTAHNGGADVLVPQAIQLVVQAVLTPFLVVLGSFIYAGVLHLSLMVCGGAKQQFEATYRTYAYATGAVSVFYVIPIVSFLIIMVWGMVALVIGMARTHQISIGKSLLAVFLPTIVCCTALIVLMIAIFIPMFAARAHA